MRQKIFQNLCAFGESVLLSAVTAPGADVLPWDTALCTHLGEHQHSGELGCRVQSWAAAEWNRTAPDRWRRLHRRAYQETLRRHGKGSVVLLARVWELQKRGVLHVHPVAAYGTATQMAGARAYLQRLSELAPRYGFGFVHHKPDKVKPQAAAEAAAYISSYFVAGRGHKASIRESARSSSMPTSIVHVSVQLTRETRCTMRNLRFRRVLWAVWGRPMTMLEVDQVAWLIARFPGVALTLSTSAVHAPPP